VRIGWSDRRRWMGSGRCASVADGSFRVSDSAGHRSLGTISTTHLTGVIREPTGSAEPLSTCRKTSTNGSTQRVCGAADNIGRFGTSRWAIVGPGTKAVSLSIYRASNSKAACAAGWSFFVNCSIIRTTYPEYCARTAPFGTSAICRMRGSGHVRFSLRPNYF